jgi:hypothetical protein
MRLPSTNMPTVHARVASAPLVYVLAFVAVRVRVRVLVAGHTLASSTLPDDSIRLNALDIFLKGLFWVERTQHALPARRIRQRGRAGARRDGCSPHASQKTLGKSRTAPKIWQAGAIAPLTRGQRVDDPSGAQAEQSRLGCMCVSLRAATPSAPLVRALRAQPVQGPFYERSASTAPLSCRRPCASWWSD